MSCISPCTVPMHTLPKDALASATSMGFSRSSAVVMHFADISISGTNTSPREKALPTSVIPVINPLFRIS